MIHITVQHTNFTYVINTLQKSKKIRINKRTHQNILAREVDFAQLFNFILMQNAPAHNSLLRIGKDQMCERVEVRFIICDQERNREMETRLTGQHLRAITMLIGHTTFVLVLVQVARNQRLLFNFPSFYTTFSYSLIR